MSFRIFALIYMACFATLSMGLYLVKYSVQNLQHEVVAMQDNVSAEKESLHLLNAEWAYLNRPDRLNHLAQEHLDLVPMDSKRIENMNLLPVAASTTPAQELPKSSMLQPINHTVEER